MINSVVGTDKNFLEPIQEIMADAAPLSHCPLLKNP